MTYKLAVIGYGNMGSWHCKNVKERISGLEVVAVYDIDEKRRLLAKEDGFIVYDTENEFFKCEADLVLVATPNNFHKDHCIKAMENGKNVVCEKPACLNLTELEEVIAVSNKTGKLYTVHQNRRFDTDYAIIKNIVKGKLLGNHFYLNSRLYGNRGFSSAGWKSLYETGGGLLYDWGIHMIDQVLCLFENDRPISVYAELQRVRMTNVDDVCRVVIEFESGVRAQIIADLWCYVSEARWHLEGSEGSAVIYNWFGKDGKIIRAKNQDIKWEEGCFYTPNGLSTTMWPRAEQDLEELSLPIPDELPRWEDYYENIIKVLDGRATQIVTHDQIRLGIKVLTAAFESAEKNNVVKL
ncbi:MAG: Gfo/Idh/MocA family oxidoreductase [Clostridia bacterium]|nr:Gfo/Idh/MocA family oxidoreductase [Clostridia bacterium]